MFTVIIFVMGFFIGGFIGIAVMSIFFVGKRDDSLNAEYYKNIFSPN